MYLTSLEKKDDTKQELGRDILAIDFSAEMLEAMDDNPHDRLLHSRICSALTKLATSSEQAGKRIVLEGGLKTVLKYSERHADYGAMQESTCALLKILAKNNHANQSEIVRLGGLRTIIRVLEFRESFESDGGIIYSEAISALANLAANRVRILFLVVLLLAENEKSIIESGALKWVLQGLLLQTSLEMLKKSCLAVSTLGSVSVTNRIALFEGGVLQLARVAVSKHPNSVELVEKCIQFVADLCITNETHNFIIKEEFLNFVCNYMIKHVTNPNVMFQCLRLLSSLTFNSMLVLLTI